MCTLDIKALKRTRNAYIIISAFVLICDIVSEFYSHDVYSLFSRFAFLITLIGGAVVYTVAIKLSKRGITPGIWSYRLYNAGIAFLTVGASVKGALDVYGTSNSLVTVYLWIGLALLIASIAAIKLEKSKKELETD